MQRLFEVWIKDNQFRKFTVFIAGSDQYYTLYSRGKDSSRSMAKSIEIFGPDTATSSGISEYERHYPLAGKTDTKVRLDKWRSSARKAGFVSAWPRT
jgi:hypothetical protein